jgi:putative peptide zinc metalloprotease protein
MEAPSHSTYQLGGIVLRLRDDLDVSARLDGGVRSWLLIDEWTSRFFRVGQPEYVFLSLLDGRRTFASAFGRAAAILKESALTESEAAALCRWLVEEGLATTDNSRLAARVLAAAATQRKRRIWSRLLNPLSQRLPVCNPDRILAALATAFGWVFSPGMACVWLMLLCAGGICLARDWERFRQATPAVVDRDNWLWLLATTAILKLVHETAHGLACRRYGGAVRDAGIVFFLLAPIPYVDVTSSWRFGGKLQRIVTASAGMLAEMGIAAAAACLWSQTDSPLIQQHAANVMVSASLVTVLVNANPLMRFDGYFVLADALEIPNLAQTGQLLWRNIFRRCTFGLQGAPVAVTGLRRALTVVYGAAAMVWRVTVCAGLILAADAMFFGAGAVLAVLAMLSWVIWPLARGLKFALLGSDLERPSRLRFGLVAAGVATAVWGAAYWLHWNPGITTPAVVMFDPVIEIRAAVGGRVRDVLVQDGSEVFPGQKLLLLENDELTASLAEVRLQLGQAQVRADRARQGGRLAEWEAEHEQLAALEEREHQLETQVAALTVATPRAGLVLDSNLASLHGRYVRPGELLFSLGAPEDRHVVSLVSPADRRDLERMRGQSLELRIDGRPGEPHSVRVLEINPRAQRELPHFAFGGAAGGPLPVCPKHAERPESKAGYELVEPRFLARMSLPDAARSPLLSGETGSIRLRGNGQPLGALCTEAVREWWTTRTAALTDQWYQ